METFSSVSASGLHVKSNSKTTIVPEQASVSEGSLEPQWAAPADGCLKANVDAVLDESTKKAGLRVIIRKHRGGVVLSEWILIPFCAIAEEAKILACLDGLKHLLTMQSDMAIVKSDCLHLHVVQILAAGGHDKSHSWSLYREGNELLNVYQVSTYFCVKGGSSE